MKKLSLIFLALLIAGSAYGADKSTFYKDLYCGPFVVTQANGNVLTTGTLGAGATTVTDLTDSALTASQILASDANKKLTSLAVATYPSLAELVYVKGVTSAIQTQLGTKLANVIEDTTPQLGGNLDLNQFSVQLSASPTSDHTANGNIVTLTAGTALVFGDVCYMGSDGKMEKGDADLTGNLVPFAICLATIAENATGLFALAPSFVRDDTWAWASLGLPVFLSATAGALTQTAPSGAAQEIQIIGIAITADIMYFNPQLIQAEHI